MTMTRARELFKLFVQFRRINDEIAMQAEKRMKADKALGGKGGHDYEENEDEVVEALGGKGGGKVIGGLSIMEARRTFAGSTAINNVTE